jgi:hypothetical protein
MDLHLYRRCDNLVACEISRRKRRKSMETVPPRLEQDQATATATQTPLQSQQSRNLANILTRTTVVPRLYGFKTRPFTL